MNPNAFIIHLRFKGGSKGGYGARVAGERIMEHCERKGMRVRSHKNRSWLVFNRYEVIVVGIISKDFADETEKWCMDCLEKWDCQAIRHEVIDMYGIDDMVSRRLFF